MKWLIGASGTWWWKFIVLGRNANAWALSVEEQNQPEPSMGLPNLRNFALRHLKGEKNRAQLASGSPKTCCARNFCCVRSIEGRRVQPSGGAPSEPCRTRVRRIRSRGDRPADRSPAFGRRPECDRE